jgi:hypothetical protein
MEFIIQLIVGQKDVIPQVWPTLLILVALTFYIAWKLRREVSQGQIVALEEQCRTLERREALALTEIEHLKLQGRRVDSSIGILRELSYELQEQFSNLGVRPGTSHLAKSHNLPDATASTLMKVSHLLDAGVSDLRTEEERQSMRIQTIRQADDRNVQRALADLERRFQYEDRARAGTSKA